MLAVSSSLREGIHRVHLSGTLDASGQPALEAWLRESASSQRPSIEWALDLSQVSYLDITGMDLLVWLRYEIRQRGDKLRLTGVREQAWRMLQDANLDRYFGPLETYSSD